MRRRTCTIPSIGSMTSRSEGLEAWIRWLKKNIGFNTYQFAACNPVVFNDPLGDYQGQGGPGQTYMDWQGDKWHSPGVLHGTAFGYGLYDWQSNSLSWEFGSGSGGIGGTYSFGNGGQNSELRGIRLMSYGMNGPFDF